MSSAERDCSQTRTYLKQEQKIFLNAMTCQQWGARTHLIQDYIRSHTPLARKLLNTPSALTRKPANVTAH